MPGLPPESLIWATQGTQMTIAADQMTQIYLAALRGQEERKRRVKEGNGAIDYAVTSKSV